MNTRYTKFDEFIYDSKSRRVCCMHQGEVYSNEQKKDVPCLICAGKIRTIKDTFVCPFTSHNIKRKFVVFRESIVKNLITANERYFDIQQKLKIGE